MTDKDLLKMLGLYDRSVTLTLEDDIMQTTDKIYQAHLEHEQKKKEFITMFKENFDELCIFMEKDPQRRVSVNCRTCVKGMNLRDQYGKQQKK